MTKGELIKFLEPFTDECPISVAMPSETIGGISIGSMPYPIDRVEYQIDSECNGEVFLIVFEHDE